MRKIEAHIQNFLQPYTNQRIAVACSGGVDSMLLLNLLIKFKIHPAVLHVNYQLRGEDSMLDAQFIKSFCIENRLEYFDLNINLKSKLNLNGGNLQQEARRIRYQFFESFNDGNTKILLAHHADDQIETFFLNLARGGGIMGLSCMLEVNGIYLRPLLPFLKKEIIEYAHEECLKWREDVSNEKLDYSRNKLRKVFIPQLEAINPNLKTEILYLIEKFQQTQKDLEKKVNPIYQEVVATQTLEFHVFDSLTFEEINELVRLFAFKPSFTSRLMELRNASNGKFLKFSLIDSSNKIEKIFKEGKTFRLVFREEKMATEKSISVEKNVTLPNSFDKFSIYVNPEKINGELKLRRWAKGDRIKPIGLSGSKLVSDILKDAKVPLAFRKNQWVVHDDINLIWVVGHSVSRDAVANNKSPVWKVSVDRE